jgi:hypothetical protein
VNPGRTPAPIATAIVVTDRTAKGMLDMSPRQFQAFLREQEIPHFKQGRRTIARLDRVLEVIDRLSTACARAAWDEKEIIALAARGGRR